MMSISLKNQIKWQVMPSSTSVYMSFVAVILLLLSSSKNAVKLAMCN